MDLPEGLRQALADRYRLERELGQGGMATVYLATDLRHERSVALKVVQPGLASSFGADRFLREIRTTAQLTHPHILPLLDSGEADGTLFYVMPYVEGESLRDRLTREKQLPLDVAVRIAREVADALGYAHGRGVVHRDIKPDNILFESGHAVVADFGIARAMDRAGGGTLTATGMALGTPQYMSPEQAAGERDVDGRADVYSLGCVLYEMLAGEPPFTGPTAESVARQHLAVDPRPVTALRPAVGPALEEVVRRALEKTPADRYETAEAFAAALAGPAAPPERGAPKARGARSLRPVALPVSGALLVVVVAALVAFHPWKRGGAADAAASRVIVLPYDNETGDPTLEPLGRMAAEWITEGLAQSGEVQVVPNLMVVQALEGRGGAGAGPRPLRVLAQALESGIAVTGSYYVQGDSLEFHSTVVDVATGQSLGTVAAVRGPRREPGAAMEELRGRVMGVLALRLSALMRWELPGGGRAPSYEAYRAYASGMERWIAGDFLAAGPEFVRAYALDSTYLRALLLAIGAYRNGGDRRRADSVEALVLPRRQQLSPYDRYRLDFLLAPDREAALRALRAATELVPVGTARHALILTLLRAGRPHESARNLEAVLATQPQESAWWSYYAVWSLRLELLHVMGEHRRELDVSAQALARLPQSLHVMRARGAALAATGRVDEARQLADVVLATPPQPGISPAEVLLSVAAELRAHGHREASVALAGRVLDWLRVHDERGRHDPDGWFLRVDALCAAERWDSAAVVLAHLRGDTAAVVPYLGFRAVIASRRGAADTAAAALARLARLPAREDSAQALLWQARAEALLGRREEAVALVGRALRGGYPFGVALHADQFLEPLRGYAPFEALMNPTE